MHRSNPLGLATGALFLGVLLLAWYALHDFPLISKIALGIVYCALLSMVGFWIWQHGQRRARLIEDIPTSNIATAPQGYVELLGRAVQLENEPLMTGRSGTPCLWYRWEVARRGEAGHAHDLVTTLFSNLFFWPEQSESSQYCFGIEDSTGTARIFPYQAEILSAHQQIWYEGDARITEERIMPGDALYVLGDFSTHDPGQTPFNKMDEVSTQISVWQADPISLLHRFDTNRNGRIDPDEWEDMHREAFRLARQKETELISRPIAHRISAPEHDRHFLLSTRPPETLAGHYRFWRSLGLVFFLGGGALAIWMSGWILLR